MLCWPADSWAGASQRKCATKHVCDNSQAAGFLPRQTRGTSWWETVPFSCVLELNSGAPEIDSADHFTAFSKMLLANWRGFYLASLRQTLEGSFKSKVGGGEASNKRLVKVVSAGLPRSLPLNSRAKLERESSSKPSLFDSLARPKGVVWG